MIICENFTVVSVSSLFSLILSSAVYGYCIFCATRLTGLVLYVVSRPHLLSGSPKLVLI